MTSISKQTRYGIVPLMLAALCSVNCAEKHEAPKASDTTNPEAGISEYRSPDVNYPKITNEVRKDTTPNFLDETVEPVLANTPQYGNPGEYVCDMRDAPMCRQTIVMPPNTQCSELTDDRDCDVSGKIAGKFCRLFGEHDCRQVTKCSDLTALGKRACHGEMLGRLFANPGPLADLCPPPITRAFFTRIG